MSKLGVINGLRGIAILAVIYHHLFSGFTGPGFTKIDFGAIPILPLSPLANGWLGVNLFFVLSGFVLASLSYRFIEFGHVRDTRKLFLLRPRAS